MKLDNEGGSMDRPMQWSLSIAQSPVRWKQQGTMFVNPKFYLIYDIFKDWLWIVYSTKSGRNAYKQLITTMQCLRKSSLKKKNTNP